MESDVKIAAAAAQNARTDVMRGPALRDVRLEGRLGEKEGAPDIKAKVCDFQSAADFRFGNNFTWFSIWF